MAVLGLDTSNYTTSCALYDNDGNIYQQRMLLPVKDGELGVRQSDAVFHHVRQLPLIVTKLFDEHHAQVDAIGVSIRPRPIEGSYMPCFEAGRSSAEQLAAVLGVPVYTFSHQEGHIASALYSAGCLDTIGDRFAAFHLSGGTTEAVLVTRDNGRFAIEYICGSLDLKAGQTIDRVANMLGLPFPGGAHLEKLALQCTEQPKCRPTMKGMDCCLSGVENRCRKLLTDGAQPELVARTCLEYVIVSVEGMAKAIIEKYGDIPLLFAGGVSSNTIMKQRLSARFGAHFAQPAFSCDNAAGIALLAARAHGCK